MNMSLLSIVIPTLGRESLYPLVDNLLKQEVNLNFEIILISQAKLKENLLSDKRIIIKYEDLGRGFAYYRNTGIELSKGEIITFIDDDEIPIDLFWLNNITEPIRNDAEQVVTAGTRIELGQGYMTDCISLLGFPGGGAVGFETIWPLKEIGYTDHLCSGNFAISKELLIKVDKFSLDMKSGNEDVNLADKLNNNKIRIKYKEDATIYHIARKGFIKFIKWNYLRGKSVAEYLKQSKGNGKVGGRLASSKKIVMKTIKTKYFFGVLFVMLNQYFWQTAGYAIKKCKK